MKHSRKKKVNPKPYCQFPVEELQKRYFRYYHYNFWLTKAKALLFFIHTPNVVIGIQPENKEDSIDSIIQNFKMEMHMMVFHQTESLFLNILAAIHNPNFPWIFLSKCTPKQLNDSIEIVRKQGLSGLFSSPTPSDFMFNLMYPGRDDKHEKFTLMKKTCDQVVKYLQLLASEYVDHVEYNSYKHGMRCFPHRTKGTFSDEQSGKVLMHSEQDSIQFLEFRDETIKGMPHERITICDKTYDYQRDYRLIDVNTAIMLNIFNKRRVDIDATPEKPGTTYWFNIPNEDVNLTDVFKFDTTGSVGGFITKFCI